MKYPDYMDYYLSMSINQDGHEVVNVYGNCVLPVYSGNSDLIISSNSEIDHYEGEGAQVVKVNMLTNNFDASAIEVDMEGTTPIEIDGIHRIQSIEVVKAGGLYTNDGMITLYDSENVYCIMGERQGKSLHCHYTIPYDKCGYIVSMHTDSDDVFDVFTRCDDVITKQFSFSKWVKFKAPFKIVGGTDIMLKSEKGSNCMYQLLLIDEVI